MSLTSNSTAYAEELSARMREACGGLSFSEVARRTGTNRETTRRYIAQGKPSVEFMARFCDTFGVAPAWLLCARGPKFDARPPVTPSQLRSRRAERMPAGAERG